MKESYTPDETLESNNESNNDETPQDKPKQAFAVLQLALRYSRLEVSIPSYQYFKDQEKPEWSPKIETEIQTKNTPLGESRHEVSLTILITGKTQQGQTIFQVKLEQTGVFHIEGFNEKEQETLLKGYAPNQLYPYIAARVNELLVHAGFPAIQMAPVDFLTVHQRNMAKG